jgi:hypothetical protein
MNALALHSVMRALDPRIHDEMPHSQAVLIFTVGIHHGLHRNSGLPEFCINQALQVG